MFGFVLDIKHLHFLEISKPYHRLCLDFISLHIITEDIKEVKVKLKINNNKILCFELMLIHNQASLCTFYVMQEFQGYVHIKNDLSATLLRSIALFSTSFWIFSISSTSTLAIMQSNIAIYGCAY